MADVREEVYSRFFAKLEAIADVEAERNRDKAVDESEAMPRLNQVDEGHSDRIGVAGQDEYTGRVSVEGYVKAPTFATAGPAINVLWASVVAAVMVDRALGGYALNIRHKGMSDPEVVREDGRKGYVAAAFFFEIDFATAEGDPASLPS